MKLAALSVDDVETLWYVSWGLVVACFFGSLVIERQRLRLAVFGVGALLAVVLMTVVVGC